MQIKISIGRFDVCPVEIKSRNFIKINEKEPPGTAIVVIKFMQAHNNKSVVL